MDSPPNTKDCHNKVKALRLKNEFTVSEAEPIIANKDQDAYQIDENLDGCSRERSPKVSYDSYLDSNRETGTGQGHIDKHGRDERNIQDPLTNPVVSIPSDLFNEEGSAISTSISNDGDLIFQMEDISTITGDVNDSQSAFYVHDINETTELLVEVGKSVTFERLKNVNDENCDPLLPQRGRLSGNRGRCSKRGKRRGRVYEENDFSVTKASVDSNQTSVLAVLQPSAKSPLQTNNKSVNHIERGENAHTSAETESFEVKISISPKPRPYRLVTRRFRGKGGAYRASMCKNGLYCRLHDVLAPTSTILDNCMNALNIPHFAPIQLMNYGDEIFELESKRHLQIAKDTNFERNGDNDSEQDNKASVLVEIENNNLELSTEHTDEENT